MRFLLALVVMFAAPFGAFGATFQFSGVMTDGDVASGVSVGDPFSGTVTVNTSIGAEAGSTINTATYHAITSLSVSIGSWTAGVNEPSGARGVLIENYVPIASPPPDKVLIFSSVFDGGLSGPLLGGVYSISLFSLELLDFSNLALTSRSLPTSLNVSDFDFARVRFELEDGSTGFTWGGTVTSISNVADPPPINSVPLPGTLILMLSALSLVRRASQRALRSPA